jgi:thiamine pyrophosphate-dependent acetolactate synthase large subunit-like protein
MNGGDIIARVLKNQGVKFLFSLCGGHISPILVGAKHQGIRVIDVRQEPTAVFAADAVSRLTGIPGVAAVTAGPGVTNSITALKNAQMAQSPLILLGGAPPTVLKGRGALQDIDHLKLVKTVVKWAVSINQDCDIVPAFEEAFDVSRSGVPGPVFIECPLDLLYDKALVQEWYLRKSGKALTYSEKAINWYLRRHVDKIFACSGKSLDLAGKESMTPFSVDPEKVQNVRHRLSQAKAPILVIGSQATLFPDKVRQLSEQLRNFGIPTYLTGMARGLMGADHPMLFRHQRAQALKKADLVMIAGMPCDFRLDYGRVINPKAFYIAINRSKDDLKKNKKPHMAILQDPCMFLLELTAKAESAQDQFSSWVEQLKDRDSLKNQKIKETASRLTEFINPLLLCEKINAALDNDSIIIGDGGDFVGTASYIVKPRKPLSWLDPGAFGTLGVGAGFAIAAKLVRPDAEVWLLYGDGAAGYGLIEQDTFVRHALPIITVIGNDAGWTQIARDQKVVLGDDVGTVLQYSKYHKTAESLDAEGLLLEDDKKIDRVLESAKKKAREGRPVLVNAFLGQTDFRKGSISV